MENKGLLNHYLFRTITQPLIFQSSSNLIPTIGPTRSQSSHQNHAIITNNHCGGYGIRKKN
jgi:hypothetical protein